jgi:hypothetical protein
MNGGIALDLGTRSEVSFTPPQLYTHRREAPAPFGEAAVSLPEPVWTR